jgi:hypothetical protein
MLIQFWYRFRDSSGGDWSVTQVRDWAGGIVSLRLVHFVRRVEKGEKFWQPCGRKRRRLGLRQLQLSL